MAILCLNFWGKTTLQTGFLVVGYFNKEACIVIFQEWSLLEAVFTQRYLTMKRFELIRWECNWEKKKAQSYQNIKYVEIMCLFASQISQRTSYHPYTEILFDCLKPMCTLEKSIGYVNLPNDERKICVQNLVIHKGNWNREMKRDKRAHSRKEKEKRKYL